MMSSSYVTGSGSSAYTSLGGLFRARLQQSNNPRLQAIAQQLNRQDQRAKILQDVISPQGFVGADGKMKYIPGISFSKNNAMFEVLQAGMEISEESLKRQIDAFAEKRQNAKFDRLLEENRQKTLTDFYEVQSKARLKRQQARIAATNAYLEKAFGINKQKTERSDYSDKHRPEDFQIFGSYTGNTTDFVGDYALHSGLTAHFAPAISYDYDSNATTKQSIKISDYQYNKPADTPSEYVVRLTGNAKYDPNNADGDKLRAPAGKLAYQDASGTTQTISGSDIARLTQAEFDTLEYVMDLTGRADSAEGDKRAPRQDYLSVMAVAPDAAGEMQRGYISKISLSRGEFTAMPSSSGDQVYAAKMFIPRGQFFNAFTLHAQGTYVSDGTASTNAGDGTLLDMVNEGRVEFFAREIGYDTRLHLDVDQSSDDTLVFTKESSQLITDGIEFFITVKEADRDNISLSALNMGAGKA